MSEYVYDDDAWDEGCTVPTIHSTPTLVPAVSYDQPQQHFEPSGIGRGQWRERNNGSGSERAGFTRSNRGFGGQGNDRNSSSRPVYDRNSSSRGGFDRNDSERGGFDRNDSERGGFDRNSSGRSGFDRSSSSRGFDRGGGGGNDRQGPPEILHISRSDVGRIIGKGGCKIRELQEQSGARLKVDDSETGDGESVVKIFGDGRSQEKARDLINELINESNDSSIMRMGANLGNKFIGGRRPGLPIAPPSTNSAPIDWAKASADYEEFQKERWAKLPPLKKNFYFEDPEISTMHSDEVDQFRLENNNIMVSWFDDKCRKPIPNPVITFEHAFGHFPEILDELEKQGFEKPSPIQCQAWPVLLQGLDLIGIAQTGTGKTFAFLLPALIHIDSQTTPRDQRGGPNVLILAPTRELAQQIEKEANKLNYRGIKSVCVYGGGSRRDQINIVTSGVQIVIATPGRLNDLVMAGFIKVSSVTYLILDEADRMLDMGFEPQIKKILLDIRPDRQTVMTSATWPEGVRRLANQYMHDPLQVCVGTLDLAAVHTVEQHIEIVSQDAKREHMYQFIENMKPDDKVIIFVCKKSLADDLSSDFALRNIPCQSMHGDREQCEREQALEDLKFGDVKILVATDVASRGLDIKDITHIYNYDFPRNMEEYVHRVGRTGRAGRTGQAITLFTRENWSQAKELIRILVESNQHVPSELHAMAERFETMKIKRDSEGGGPRNFRGGSGGFRNGGGGGGGRRGGRSDFMF